MLESFFRHLRLRKLSVSTRNKPLLTSFLALPVLIFVQLGPINTPESASSYTKLWRTDQCSYLRISLFVVDQLDSVPRPYLFSQTIWILCSSSFQASGRPLPTQTTVEYLLAKGKLQLAFLIELRYVGLDYRHSL